MTIAEPPDGWSRYCVRLRVRMGMRIGVFCGHVGCTREALRRWLSGAAIPQPVFRRRLLELGYLHGEPITPEPPAATGTA